MKNGLRHAAVTIVILAVLGGSAAAGGPGGKVVERPYRTPVIGAAYGSTYYAYYYNCNHTIGCAIIPTGGRLFATVEVEDATGQNVFFSVNTMPGGSHLGDFCGSTDEPLATYGARELLVHVVAGVCDDGSTPSTPTTGMVRATLSKKA